MLTLEVVTSDVDIGSPIVSESLSGRFIRVGGKVEPDENGKQVLRKLQRMRLLASSGRTPEFYFDPREQTCWEFEEFEDGQIHVRHVTREYITTNWPTVDCDRTLTVGWPVRY